jgi:hypothetical protein
MTITNKNQPSGAEVMAKVIVLLGAATIATLSGAIPVMLALGALGVAKGYVDCLWLMYLAIWVTGVVHNLHLIQDQVASK